MRRDAPLFCGLGENPPPPLPAEGPQTARPPILGEAVWLELEFLSHHEIKLPDVRGIRLRRCRSRNRAFGLVRARSIPRSPDATESTSPPTTADLEAASEKLSFFQVYSPARQRFISSCHVGFKL